MSDKEYREQKKRVQKYINKWFRPMGIGWFAVDFVWSRETKNGKDCDVAADADVKWEYRKALITYYLPVIKDIDDSKVENVVIHEFVHILLGGLNREDTPQEVLEYTTELVTSSFGWVRDAGKKD